MLRAKVQLLNDNYTPMEFVVHLLERVFEMEREPAMRLMLEIHEKGPPGAEFPHSFETC